MSATQIIVGFGYLGARVGRLWCDAGSSVTAMTRSSSHPLERGVEMFHADVTIPDSLAELRKRFVRRGTPPEAVLYAVGYDRTGGADIHAVYATGLQNVLAALPSSVLRVIYISTTGVYGPAGSDWVDELTPPDPQREGGHASRAAEQVLAAHPLGRRSAILRLAGLYGPGRVPHLDKLRAGEPLPVPSEGWLNLIHVDDAARVVVAADAWLASLSDEQLAAQGRSHIFCVSDGNPVRRADYYAEAARVLGARPPTFTAPPPESPAAARAAASRRVRNTKMHETFGPTLQYPSYREGLAAILAPSS